MCHIYDSFLPTVAKKTIRVLAVLQSFCHKADLQEGNKNCFKLLRMCVCWQTEMRCLALHCSFTFELYDYEKKKTSTENIAKNVYHRHISSLLCPSFSAKKSARLGGYMYIVCPNLDRRKQPVEETEVATTF